MYLYEKRFKWRITQDIIEVCGIKFGIYSTLNEYMSKGHSLTLVQGHSNFVDANIFKHLLRNHLANQSQI